MSRRIDYYDDPNAPKANSIVPSVNVVVTNDRGEILLIRRSDNDNWAIPGGAIDLGESMTEAAIRETREETGIMCEITGVVGIYTDPKHVILYTSNGEARQEFSIVLTATAVGGTLAPSSESSESSEVRWVPRDELANLQMDRSMTMRIAHYLAGYNSPHLGLLTEHVRTSPHRKDCPPNRSRHSSHVPWLRWANGAACGWGSWRTSVRPVSATRLDRP